jgi:regulator of cell morphogenesis and NO signaling
MKSMFLSTGQFGKESFVRDIVASDYRTAEVFQKYDIEFCCGGKWPLETVCMMKGIEPEQLLQELSNVTRQLHLPSSLPFDQWNVDFLIDYIINIHHHYLRKTLPELWPVLNKFVDEHLKKDNRLDIVQNSYRKLQKEILPHLLEEEQDMFPYIRQLAHAYHDNEPYAGLLVKTLRRPIVKMMGTEHENVRNILLEFRNNTDNYTPPEKSCTSHRVVFSKLKELDHDLAQHMYLENQVLFPKALAMETELLQRKA